MAAKLPLIARKNIRDEYEAKKGGLLERIKEYTGEDYEFIVDFQEKIYPNIDTAQSYQVESPGSIAFSAYEGLADRLKTVTDEGEDQLVKDFFNEVVSSRKIDILIEPMESGYTACRVRDGVLELVFKTDNYGTNSWYLTEKLINNLDEAYAETNKGELPLEARKGWQDDFVAKKDQLEADIAEELLGTKVTLVADPVAIWRTAVEEYDKLKKRDKDQIDLESIRRNMGSAVFSYFDGFRYQINYKFKQDDLMVETFLETAPSKEVRFELVPELSPGNSYHEALFTDDAFVMRTTPKNWYTNSSYVCEKIDTLL
ncbi:hypothetical protein TWF106_007099 [Orbilia oligospora]|uniref:Uncharacterized protein n=1 Tax=Orbilia oligospora TaxID=2813651 RepID=A0A6G1M4D3_ORBOL|nr:hypothetical protein TWF788_009906 [Orbilia oligospora]KAF3207890.1 hypothetical protein TWF679_008220 [Orbilia oligospora]KAF3219258.1 hypothetical protein TWF106_007099 [Orbilia oligospora]KAF3220497.1 hypothetical protein TWF191_007396 [Orbilia oligospora]KAF3244747.1 hypothetical protein TWF192_007679 [Orbilia oligospora]